MQRLRWQDRLRRHWIALLVGLIIAVVAAWTVSRVTTRPGPVSQRVVVASGPWVPFVGSELPEGGPVARVVAEVFRRAGYDPQLSFSSWPVVEQRTAQQQVVASFPFIASPGRRDDFTVSDPIMEFDYVLFYSTSAHPDGLDISDSAALADLRVGLIDGYEPWSELDAAVAQFVPMATSEAGFRALVASESEMAVPERIDVLVEGRLPGEAVVAASAWDADVVAEVTGDDGLVGSRETLHLLAPSTDAGRSLVTAFDVQLEAVKGTELYSQAVEEVATSAADNASLVALGDEPVVRLWSSSSGQEGVVTPVGTQVTVMAWPLGFTDPAPPSRQSPGRVQVKVANGPSRGRVMWVDAGTLRLGRAS